MIVWLFIAGRSYARGSLLVAAGEKRVDAKTDSLSGRWQRRSCCRCSRRWWLHLWWVRLLPMFARRRRVWLWRVTAEYDIFITISLGFKVCSKSKNCSFFVCSLGLLELILHKFSLKVVCLWRNKVLAYMAKSKLIFQWVDNSFFFKNWFNVKTTPIQSW